MNTRCINCINCNFCSDSKNLTNCYGLHGACNQANVHMPCRVITGTYRVQYAGRIRTYQGEFLQHALTTVTIHTEKPWIILGERIS